MIMHVEGEKTKRGIFLQRLEESFCLHRNATHHKHFSATQWDTIMTVPPVHSNGTRDTAVADAVLNAPNTSDSGGR